MIPVATEKAGLPDDWSVLGAAVFAGIGVVVVRPHLYSIRSPPQGIVLEGTRSHRRQLQGKSKKAKGRMKKLGDRPTNNFCLFPFAFCLFPATTFVLRIRKMKDIVKLAFPFTNHLQVT
jgi:hypothetical protein